MKSRASSVYSMQSSCVSDREEDFSDYEYNDFEEDDNSIKDVMMDEYQDVLDELNKRKPSSELLTVQSFTPLMNIEVQSISEALNIPHSAAVISLRKYNWDRQRLLDSFITNKDECTVEAGVYHKCIESSSQNHTRSGSMCAICFDDDMQSDQMYSMPCGHAFCVDCWTGYVRAKMGDGPSCLCSTCPDTQCKELITEEEVQRFAPDLLHKFCSYQVGNFIEHKDNTRWCPGPDCDKIATLPKTQVIGETGIEIKCQSCNTSFCLSCGDEPHKPLSCKELKQSMQTFTEEGSEKWILQNTKPCPKCMVRIEKNQGCNHMTCNRCNHEFCWICNGDWYNHAQCNRFESDAISDEKKELARDLHYVKRFHIHADAQKFAVSHLAEVRNELQSNGSKKDAIVLGVIEKLKEPLIKANELLVQCRRALKHTYMYAYYNLQPHPTRDQLSKSDEENLRIQREHFEYQQEMLEKFTEELSEMTEKPLAAIEKVQLMNRTEAVKRFLAAIVMHASQK